MAREFNLGSLNGHSVGRILKEAVRRAMVTIRRERLIFEATIKESYAGNMDDVFTSADTKAQEVYLRTFTECFPDCGVICEEGNLKIESKNGFYFTVDPLDGTKAYTRRQSHGVSTMVALVYEDEVIAAYIGDVNTNEIYGYRPGSNKVHRITDLDSFETLKQAASLNSGVESSYALLRDPLDKYSEKTRPTIQLFKSYESMGSSIGTWAARLWKGEVQALFLTKGFETPWDSTPVIGISQKLNYSFYRLDGAEWEAFDPILPLEVIQREYDLMIMP